MQVRYSLLRTQQRSPQQPPAARSGMPLSGTAWLSGNHSDARKSPRRISARSADAKETAIVCLRVALLFASLAVLGLASER